MSKTRIDHDHPFYPLAMLQTAAEIKSEESDLQQLGYVRNLVASLCEEMHLPQDDFQTYLEEYRDNLRRNCKRKGYA